jgi:photosystem II stability/assembly factor-like uncharacterized protein
MKYRYIQTKQMCTSFTLSWDKLISLRSGKLVSVSIFVLLLAATASYSQNVYMLEQTGVTVSLRGVSFVDDINGFAVGDSGTIIHTTNGGKNWVTQISSTTNSLLAVSCLSADTCWAVGTGGTVLSTFNGGATWNTMNPGISATLRSIYSFSTVAFIAVGDSGTILQTTNSGSNWTIGRYGSDALNSVSFGNADTGVAIGNAGTILRTSNAGVVWDTVQSGVTYSLSGVSFISSTAGCIVFPSGELGITLHTTDAGRTWWKASAGNPTYGQTAVACIGYFVTACGGTLDWATDGGGDWQGTGNPIGFLMHAVCAIPSGPDFVVAGDYGTVFRYIDARWDPPPTQFVSPPDGLDSLQLVTGPAGDTSQGVWLIWRRLFNGPVANAMTYSINVQGGGAIRSGFDNQFGAPWVLGVDTSVFLGSLAPGDTINWSVSLGFAGNPLGGPYPYSTSETRRFAIPPAPPPDLLSPADESIQQLTFNSSQPSSVTFVWHTYTKEPKYGNPSYDFEVGTDSTFGSGVAQLVAQLTDTTHVVNYLNPATKYYWQVRADYGSWVTEWQQRTFTTSDIEALTISQIQQVNSSALVEADSLQSNAPPSLQYSPYLGQILRTTGICLNDPTVLSVYINRVSTAAFVFGDTSSGGTAPWSCVLVSAPSTSPGSQFFSSIQAGDVVTVAGVVTEISGSAGMSNTVLQATSVSRVRSATTLPTAVPLAMSTFGSGSGASSLVNFINGEPYEGSIVLLQNLTVNSYGLDASGALNLIDGAGNIMHTQDASKWFTIGPNEDPSSTFVLPPLGAHIDSIEGVIVTNGNYYNIAPINPGDIRYGAQGHRTISGIVFNDLNHDGIRENGEPPLSGFWVNINGKVTTTQTTDTNGSYSFAGLDSGKYTISVSGPDSTWQPTSGNDVTLILGATDTTINLQTGIYQFQATVTGTVFNDYNQNGVQDPGEPGVVGWGVNLSGIRSDSTITDSLGHYVFSHVLAGVTYIGAVPPHGWEQIYPSYFEPLFQLDPKSPVTSYPGYNFAVHPIPTRIKLALTVHDNIYVGNKTIYWGNRSGATYGIWGVDPATTNTDFAEGESELPSVEYAQELGFFDTRFIAPNAAASARFGEGSWTDMRGFLSPAQADTHVVSILPGYDGGAGYPMTLIWQHAAVESSFSGPVVLEGYGNTINMKQQDSVVVKDPSVWGLVLISQGPKLPVSDLLRWRMISLPRVTSDYPLVLFPSAISAPYSFSASHGYTMDSAMSSGVAYWLKCMLDTTTIALQSGNRILIDTIDLSTGWNMIPAIGVPVGVGDLVTVPNNILSTGTVFGFDAGYVFADTLEPYQGYWIKADHPGELILSSGGSSAQIAKTHTTGRGFVDDTRSRTEIAFKDALGNEQTLYVENAGSPINLSRYELPPVPPAGIFDARYASERNLETVPRGGKGVFPVLVTSAAYPLTISLLSVPNDGKIAFIVKIGDKNLPLTTKSSITLSSPVPQIALQVSSTGEPIPIAFALMQNYPNPFNPITTIQYAIPLKSHVSLKVYDVLGRLVSTLVDDTEDAGYKSVRFNGSNFASGVYMYEMRAGTFVQVKKFTITK